MQINHYLGTGMAVSPTLTYLVKEGTMSEDAKWMHFYSGIKGFDYEPGYIYKLLVDVKQIPDPPADGSSKKYTLKKILEKEKIAADTEFTVFLKLNGDSFITGDDPENYQLLKQVNVACGALCDELTTKLREENLLIGVFKHGENNSIELLGFN
ncbi:DUF4377 domain-containing protein [Robertkochia solimangrovi]|uniref:DUF4377 domain-containing protein n=1 Tax=Robertkochia solimangrovi TaxID=2213046 RepID=UPI0013A575EC|nr:DUF4377 domain-containing protein [Robertkochia solimangrovi]